MGRSWNLGLESNMCVHPVPFSNVEAFGGGLGYGFGFRRGTKPVSLAMVTLQHGGVGGGLG